MHSNQPGTHEYVKTPGRWRRKAGRRVGSWVFPRLHAGLATAGTVKKRYHPEAAKLLKQGDAVIYTWWHEYVLTLFPEGAPADATTVLTSPSDDGLILVRSLERMGYKAIKGSSRRDGAKALEALQAELATGRSVVIMPDGPMGPAHQLKSGALRLSAASGKAIIPVTAGVDRYKRLGTWDKMIVPLRPKTLTIHYHEPLLLVGAGELTDCHERLTHALSQVP